MRICRFSLCIGLLYTTLLYSCKQEADQASIYIDAGIVVGKVNPNIYGQMFENCGNSVYSGLWVGEESGIPNWKGMRKDVIERTKAIRPGNVRWPGGTPSEYYHWLDGVGPAAERPETLLPGLCLASPGETNAFGTDEYIAFCQEIGAEPYICVNVGTGTPEEAANWIEYCNYSGNTRYAALRKINGHPEPYHVKYWGIGNESYFWHTPESYSLLVQQYAKIMKTMADSSISLVAAGFNDPHIKGLDRWNYEVLKNANEFLDYISMHAYYFYDDYYDVVASPLKAEPDIAMLRTLIKELVPAHNKLEIAIDEWKLWHKEAKTYNGLMQKCTLMDGIYAAGMFHVFHRNCDVVTLTNFCDLTNQLPAIVTSEDGSLYLNPIYHAFALYTQHTGNVVLHSEVEVAGYNKLKEVGVKHVPYLDCSTTLMEDNGHMALAVINRHKDTDIETKICIEGFEPEKRGIIRVLNAPEVTTANDFNEPDNVKIETSEFEKAGKDFTYTFPAHSVTIIELEPVTEVIPYSFGSDRKSEIFKASVNQVEVPVTVVPDVSREQASYIVEQYKKLPEYCWIESRYATAHYLHFASDETARITLTLNETVHQVTVYPKRFNTELHFDGNSLSFSINRNSSSFYIVSVNDLPMVLVLAEALEKEGVDREGPERVSLTRFEKAAGLEPDYSEVFRRAISSLNGTGKTLVIPAGEYLTDAIEIIDCSDFDIYFEPGSLIKTRTSPPGENVQNEGILIKNSRNIRIYGNGCLDHQAYENFRDGKNDYHHGFPGYDYYFKFEDIPSNSIYLQSPLMLMYSQNITIEGLLIRNGRNYNINSRHCDNITLRNVKVITPAGSVPENTDGINIGSYRNFLIENSFVFCNDDAFSMGHNLLPYDNRPEQNLVIRNFMGWNPRANAIRLGWASNTHNGDMLFYNCDFSGMDDCSMQLHSHTSTGNESQDSLCYGTVRFENCTFDDVERYTRQMIDVQNACMESLQFINVSFDAIPEIRPTIYGDAERKIGTLIIDNMIIGGRKVTEENFDFDTKNIKEIIIQ